MGFFPFFGDLVNAAAVVAGGILGVLLQRFVSKRMADGLMQAVGLGTAFIGIAGALQRMFTVSLDASGTATFDVGGTVLLIASLLIGTLVGTALDLEGGLERLGTWMRRRAGHLVHDDRFNEGFVSSTLIVCTGALAVMGGLDDGRGDPGTLLVKAVLDCVVVFVVASSLGAGSVFSAIPLLLYQGVFGVVGLLVGNVMTPGMAGGLSMVGSAVVFAVGLNLLLGPALGENRIKAGNMIPAMAVPVIYAAIVGC